VERLKFNKLPLDESGNVRKGFLQDHQCEALAQATSNIGLWMRSIFEIYYTYGWRKREPLTDMRVQFDHRTIVIENSKNGEGRLVKMTQKVFELLKACCRGKGADDYVLPGKTESLCGTSGDPGERLQKQQACRDC
jgi:Phage integrase family